MTRVASLLSLLCLSAAISSGCCMNRPLCGVAPCGPANCGTCMPFVNPISALTSHVANHMTCQSGCGEIYCDEWISDPPDNCDPCDPCTGQYTGPRDCCTPSCGSRLWSFIRGKRYEGDCYGGDCQRGSCCDGGHGHGHEIFEGEYSEGEIIETVPQEIIGPPQPTPAAPREAAQEYYKHSSHVRRSAPRTVVRHNH